MVDDQDFIRVNKKRWVCTDHNYAFSYDTNEDKKGVYLHRFILNASDGEYVDHKNGNGLDNKRSNIRICTNRQNMQNTKGRRNNAKSKFKGVWYKGKRVKRKYTLKDGTVKNSYKRLSKPWTAMIRDRNGNRKYIGAFSTEIEAAQAYNETAITVHGEFACINNLPD